MEVSTVKKKNNTIAGYIVIIFAIICVCCLLPWYYSNQAKGESPTETALSPTSLPATEEVFHSDINLPAFSMGTADPLHTQIPTSSEKSALSLPTLSTTRIPTLYVVPNSSPAPNTNNSVYFGNPTKISGCVINGPYPDPACTPGSIFADATKERICVSGYSAMVRDVSESDKAQVYRMYGLVKSSADYEVDHFISLELGGNNDFANLFPEAAEPAPGYHEKDKVEDYLHDEVCDGRMTLQQAQQAIATDWVAVYKQMGGSVPVTQPKLVPVIISTVSSNTLPTIKCKDGYTYQPAHRQGACSHHGGIAPGY